MKVTLDQAVQKFLDIENHLIKDLSSVRAGRANPKLVEDIEVDVYGQRVPVKQLANVSVVDPTLLLIQPWDKNNVNEIKKSIEFADIGINPVIDGSNLRLPIPALTEERRLEYIKIMKQKVEEAKISVRQVRKDVLNGLDEQKKDKVISEDEFKLQEKQLQKEVEECNTRLDKVASEKETELISL